MTWVDIVIIIVAAAVVASAVVGAVYRKKKGKTSCGCHCANCPSAGACRLAKNGQKAETTKDKENV